MSTARAVPPTEHHLADLEAHEMARGVRERTTRALDLVDACVERIRTWDREVNAMVARRYEEAREEALALDAEAAAGTVRGPLHGVPITIKDQFRLAEFPTVMGLASRKTAREVADGPLVARLRAAGAIVLGKTNVVQVLMGWECDNAVYGRTSNPWSRDRSPGGSSGGEAAIVAYGGSPLGLGADFGGSLRLPSAFCGVCTLKPTSGRLTLLDTPHEPFSAQEAVIPQTGPITRSVEDLELAMTVLAAPGQELLDPTVAPVPWPTARPPVTQLRVGWYVDNGLFTPSPAIRRAVRDTVAALAARGATVTEVPAPDGLRAQQLFLQLVGADRLAPTRAAIGKEGVHPVLRANFQAAALPGWAGGVAARVMAATGRTRLARLAATPRPETPAAYFEVLADRRRFLLETLHAWRDVDVVVCPPVGLPAFTHGASPDLIDAVSYTFVFNVLGLPAGVLPVTHVRADEESDRPASSDPADRTARAVETGSRGLPVGVQVVAAPWREDLVLAAMAAIEATTERASFRPRRT